MCASQRPVRQWCVTPLNLLVLRLPPPREEYPPDAPPPRGFFAAFPAPGQRTEKYWPPVGRIDQVYGDRHLTCACPPLEAYMESAE